MDRMAKTIAEAMRVLNPTGKRIGEQTTRKPAEPDGKREERARGDHS